jgi:hypothetical protein
VAPVSANIIIVAMTAYNAALAVVNMAGASIVAGSAELATVCMAGVVRIVSHVAFETADTARKSCQESRVNMASGPVKGAS